MDGEGLEAIVINLLTRKRAAQVTQLSKVHLSFFNFLGLIFLSYHSCDVLNFKPSKSEKKIIKRFNKFILDGNREKMDIDCSLPGPSNINLNSTTDSSEKSKTEMSVKKVNPGLGADLSKPKCKKAKLIRLEKKNEKLKRDGTNDEKSNVKMQQTNKEKSLEDLLDEMPENGVHKFHVSKQTFVSH